MASPDDQQGYVGDDISLRALEGILTAEICRLSRLRAMFITVCGGSETVQQYGQISFGGIGFKHVTFSTQAETLWKIYNNKKHLIPQHLEDLAKMTWPGFVCDMQIQLGMPNASQESTGRGD